MINHNELIFITQIYYPDEAANSQLFSSLMGGLADKGYRINVYCGFPSTRDAFKCPSFEVLDGVQITRLGFRVSGKKNLMFRALSYLSFMIHLAPKIILAPRGVFMVAVTNPPFLVWILGLASLLRGVKFSYVFLDLHPEGLVSLGILPQNAWYVRLWKYLNKISYRRAEKLVVLGRDMTARLIREYGLNISVFRHLPLWSSSNIIEPLLFHDSKFCKTLELSEYFVVQYSGNMGLWHDINTFVRAAKKLSNHKRIRFLFVGSGIRKVGAMELAIELGVTNIIWQDFVSLDDLSQSLACCHVALISLNKNLEGVAVPSKLYGILASGRPIIAQVPIESEVAITVLENDCGFVVRPGNESDLVEAILALYMDAERCEKMAAAAFNAYSKKYQISNAINFFEKEIFGKFCL